MYPLARFKKNMPHNNFAMSIIIGPFLFTESFRTLHLNVANDDEEERIKGSWKT